MADERGVPLSIVLSGANTHDVKLLAAALDGIVAKRPGEGSPRQNLCLDAGYAGAPAQRKVEERGYVPHVRPRGEGIADKDPESKAKAGWFEVCHSWFNRFRKLLVRHEKMERSHLGLPMPAASAIVLRKIKRKDQGNIIYG